MAEQKSLKLYHLANPKGVHHLCKVCDRNARIMCPHCRLTCYCSEAHRRTDWESIHGAICDKLLALRKKNHSTFNIQTKQSNTDSRKKTLLKYLVKVTALKTKEYLFFKDYQKALPAASHLLHFSFELYGSGHLGNINPLLMIAESHLGLGRIEKAKQLYHQSEWLAKKSPSCPEAILSNLYRTLAKINFALQKYQETCRCAGLDIFHSCNVYGPKDHRAVGGYYQLGLTFEKLKRFDISKSFFEKVTDIWTVILTRIIRVKIYTRVNVEEQHLTLCLDIAEQAEAKEVLSDIYNKTLSGKTAHALGMLHYLRGEIPQAQYFCQKALNDYNPSYDFENLEYLKNAHEFRAFYLKKIHD